MAVEEVGLKLNLLQRRQTADGLREVKSELVGVADAGQDVAAGGKAAARGLDQATDSRYARGFGAIKSSSMGLAGVLGRGLVTGTKAAAVGFAAAAAGAGALGFASVKLASNAAETASAFGTVFGPAARGVQKDLDGLTSRFGLYNPELQDAARQFGVFGKAAGIAGDQLPSFSTDLTKAGLDLSSFYNVDPGTAFEALQSGLTGEAEPLRQFGIFLSDATMKAQAATMGLTGELTEQQKVMVRQAYIMGHLGDAQGDLARTSKGFANQQRAASGRTKMFLTMLGGPLTTAAAGAFRGFNAIAKRGIGLLEERLPSLNQKAVGLSHTFAHWGRQLSKELPGAIATAAGWWDVWTAKLAAFRGGDGPDLDGFRSQLDKTSPALHRIGDALSGVDWARFGNSLGDGVNDTLSVFSVVIGFAADHVDLLAAALPALIVGFAAYKTIQAANNVLALVDIPLKAAQVGATVLLARSNRALATQMGIANGQQRVGLVTSARAVVVTTAQRVATIATATATKGLAIAQRVLNAAMRANPIGLVITGITLLAGGFVLLYRKSETFRGIINGLWNNVLKPLGSFVGWVFVGYLRTLATAWLTMGRVGLKAFSWLVRAAFAAFDGILSAAEKGLGWVPGLGDKIKGARQRFDEFGQSSIGKLDQLGEKLRRTQEKLDDLGKPRTATITINLAREVNDKTGNLLGLGTVAAGLAGVPHLAKGGPVYPGRPYVVGEHRPELFVPEVRGEILPQVPRSHVGASQGYTMPDLDGDGAADRAATAYTAAGGTGRGQPLIIQNVMDQQVIGEKVVGYVRGKIARE